MVIVLFFCSVFNLSTLHAMEDNRKKDSYHEDSIDKKKSQREISDFFKTLNQLQKSLESLKKIREHPQFSSLQHLLQKFDFMQTMNLAKMENDLLDKPKNNEEPIKKETFDNSNYRTFKQSKVEEKQNADRYKMMESAMENNLKSSADFEEDIRKKLTSSDSEALHAIFNGFNLKVEKVVKAFRDICIERKRKIALIREKIIKNHQKDIQDDIQNDIEKITDKIYKDLINEFSGPAHAKGETSSLLKDPATMSGIKTNIRFFIDQLVCS